MKNNTQEKDNLTYSFLNIIDDIIQAAIASKNDVAFVTALRVKQEMLENER